MTDRIEKIIINRNTSGTHVKYCLTQDGITVNYSVKTYTSGVPSAIVEAKKGANHLLQQAIEKTVELKAVS